MKTIAAVFLAITAGSSVMFAPHIIGAVLTASAPQPSSETQPEPAVREVIEPFKAPVAVDAERDGYFYGWTIMSFFCPRYIEEQDVQNLKDVMIRANVVFRKSWLAPGFNNGKISGDVDSARFIEANGRQAYCAKVVSLGTKELTQ